MESQSITVQGSDDNRRQPANRPPRRPLSDSGAAIVLVALAGAIFLGGIFFAAAGLRGSDQYWYTAEVEQLQGGKVNQETVVFPYHAYYGVIPPPFKHHTLTHYAVLLAAWPFGAYAGWIIVNTVCTLAAAILLGLLAARLGSPRAGVFACCLALLLPLSFWITAQPYLESSLAVFVAAGLYLYLGVRDTPGKWFALAALGAAAYWCRVSFLPMLLLVPVGFLIHRRRRDKKSLFAAAVLLLIALAAIAGHRHVFSPDPALRPSRYLNSTVPGVSDNMHLLYALEDQPVELWKLAKKVAAGLKQQLVETPARVQLFYLPFNAMALLTLLLLFRRSPPAGLKLKTAILVLFGLHALTISLRGNEFRFLHVVNPVMILGTALWLESSTLFRRGRLWLGLMGTLLLVLGGLDLVFARHMRGEAARDAALRSELVRRFDRVVPHSDALMLGIESFSDKNLLFGYAVRPRLVLFTRSQFGYSREQLDVMRENLGAEWLFTRRDCPLLDQFRDLEPERRLADLPAPFESYALYRLNPP